MQPTKTIINMRKTILALTILLLNLLATQAENESPKFSTAGFFKLENSGRNVYSMNPA